MVPRPLALVGQWVGPGWMAGLGGMHAQHMDGLLLLHAFAPTLQVFVFVNRFGLDESDEWWKSAEG